MSLGYTKVTLRSETFLYINTSYPSMHVFSVHPSAIMHLPKQGCVDIQVVVDSFDAVFFGHQISQCFEHDVGKSRRISTTRNPRHSRVSDQENKKSMKHSTMGQKRKKHRINSLLIIYFPTSKGVSEMSKQANEWASERTSEHSEGRERSQQSGASEQVSGTSEQENGRVSGTVLQSIFGCSGPHCNKAQSRWRWFKSSGSKDEEAQS